MLEHLGLEKSNARTAIKGSRADFVNCVVASGRVEQQQSKFTEVYVVVRCCLASVTAALDDKCPSLREALQIARRKAWKLQGS